MKNLKVIDYKGIEIEGNWNEKVYPSKIENTKRIYVNNTEVIISLEEANKITYNTVEKQSVEYYYSKLSENERAEVLQYLSVNLQKEYKKEAAELYVNNFAEGSSKYLLIESFKTLKFEDKASTFKTLKSDYLAQQSYKANGTWHK